MNKICVILLLFFALVSCAFSSYLDIPPPPERPLRFKTKEQIENYLKAVKDYYDAFKIKLVRRDHIDHDYSFHSLTPTIDADSHADDRSDEKQTIYDIQAETRNNYPRRRYRIQRSMNTD
jgi:hypothetical protein